MQAINKDLGLLLSLRVGFELEAQTLTWYKLAWQAINKDHEVFLSLLIGFEMEPNTLKVSTFESLFTNTAAGQI